MLNDINNFIKWLGLKVFIMNGVRNIAPEGKVSNATRIARFLVFLYETYFLLGHFYFECNLKEGSLMIPDKTRANIYYEKFPLKITNKYCYKGLKSCKFTRRRNKAKHFVKKRTF